MAPAVKLYFAPWACSVAPQLILEDSGISYEAVKANIWDPSGRADYLKNVNPKGQVPVLAVDNQFITEAPAILTAISQLVPEKNYTGSSPAENVRFLEWINYLSGTVHGKLFGALFKPGAYSDDSSAEASIKAKAQSGVLAAFKAIDEKLAASGTTYAVGNNLTGVDAYLAVFVLWAKKFEIWDEAAFPSYNKLFGTIAQTPAFGAVSQKQA